MSNIEELDFNVSGSISTTVHSKPGSTGKYNLWFNGTSFSSSDGTMSAPFYWCSAEVAELVAGMVGRDLDVRNVFRRHHSTYTTHRNGRTYTEYDDDTFMYVRQAYPDVHNAMCSLIKDGIVVKESGHRDGCGGSYVFYVKA